MVFAGSQVSTGSYNLALEFWNIPTLNAGETATLNLDLFTLIGGQDITNFVEVAALDQDDSDSTPGNGTGTPSEDDEASVTITPADNGGFGGQDGTANLSLTMTADAPTVGQFNNIVFSLVLTNDGPDEATNIRVNAGLPNGTAYTSHTNSDGVYSLFEEAWSIKSLASGESITLDLNLFNLLNSGSITAYAEVFQVGQSDPNSTPANGNGTTANEDDEAAVTVTATNQVTTRSSSLAGVTMNKLYPVPTINELNIQLVNQGVAQEATVDIYDLQGRLMVTNTVFLDEGVNDHQMDLNNVSGGNYFIHVRIPEGTLVVQQFTKVGN